MNLANGRTPHPHPSKLVDTSIARKHWKDEVFIVLWWCQLVFSQLVLPVLPWRQTSETLPRQRLHMQIMTRCGAHSDTTHTTPVTQQDCKTCSYQKLVICPESFYRISFAVSLFPYSDIFSAVPEKFKKSALFQFSENHGLSDLLLVSQVKCFQSAPTWASPVNELDHDVLLLR